MEGKGPILGYWRIRGLIELAKLIMEYSGSPYQMEYFTQGPGPEFSRDSWLKVKFEKGLDFPNLPYVIDGDFKLCESLAIYMYLAHKYSKELLGKDFAASMKVTEALMYMKGLKDDITMPCYNPDPNAAQLAVEKAASKVEWLEKKLGDRDWFLGDSCTIADLMLMQITDQFQMIKKGEWLKDHATFKAHNERVKAIPNIKKYRESDRYFEGPFNNVVASTNNLPADYHK